jgi:hypothetical protein
MFEQRAKPWRRLWAALGVVLGFACSVPHFEFPDDPARSCLGDDCGPCTVDANCPGGWLCCDGTCDNPAISAMNCGACGEACESPFVCAQGSCGAVDCGIGHAECDGDTSDACETDTQSDPANCGECGNDCGDDLCSGGHCTKLTCDEGSADCDAMPDNGCESSLSEVSSCGMCGAACSDAHGTPGCDAQGCSIACNEGYGDCDDRLSTGCETGLMDDAAHCGACDGVCQNEHGATSCETGKCTPVCATGYADCNGDANDGCETEISASLTDCGGCGATCALEHAEETCDAGVCKVTTCEAGFDNCDGNAKNGCEADLTEPETCGTCGNHCSDNGGTPSCEAGKCGITCSAGRDDCKNGISDGCEVDLSLSTANCGTCGKVCPATGGTAVCNDGKCGISTCTDPFEDCDNDAKVPGGNGCETNLSNDASNCGGCGNDCYYPNGIGKCKAKACSLDHCEAGYADCTAAAGCETALGTTANCRSCGEKCTNAHGTTACSAQGCKPVCNLGFEDCDGKPENGCETPLNTLSDCGACNLACGKAHASASCATGICEIATCNDGWGDCDDEASSKNGCETDLHTLSNCGECGEKCGFDHASASCGAGKCLQGACDAGYADCASADGCETPLGSNSDCSACDNACASLHGSNTCMASGNGFDCSATCDAGFKSCDGNPDNGCEADLATASNCGNCGVKCSGNTPFCIAGSCSGALVNSATGDKIGTNGKLTFSHTLATQAGRGRVVVVLVGSDGSSMSASATTSATYDGKSMTLAKQVWGGDRVTASIYYIKDSALPGPGTYSVSITGGDYVKIANVIELRGIDQNTLLDGTAGTSGDSCTSDGPNDNITTTVSNDFILTAVAAFGLNLGSPKGTPQTPQEAYTDQAGSLGLRTGYVANASAGMRSVGWDMTSCDHSAHVLVAFRAAP